MYTWYSRNEIKAGKTLKHKLTKRGSDHDRICQSALSSLLALAAAITYGAASACNDTTLEVEGAAW